MLLVCKLETFCVNPRGDDHRGLKIAHGGARMTMASGNYVCIKARILLVRERAPLHVLSTAQWRHHMLLTFLFLLHNWQIMPFGHITPVRMVVC